MEDAEVKVVAQLIRAIADFDRVSYVASYDQARVIQALGSSPGLDDDKAQSRGQAYLEKIIEMAVPLPVLRADVQGLRLRKRRALMTALRLGLVAGEVPSDEIAKLIASDDVGTSRFFKSKEFAERQALFVERIEDVYPSVAESVPLGFWRGLGTYLMTLGNRSAAELMSAREITRQMALLPLRTAYQFPKLSTSAREVFRALEQTQEFNLRSEMLRIHFFAHGLYGNRRESSAGAIMTASEVEQHTEIFCRDFSQGYSGLGNFFSGIVSPIPVFIMVDYGAWKKISGSNDLVGKYQVIEKLVILMFGGTYTVDKQYLDKIVDLGFFLRECRQHLSGLGAEAEERLDEGQRLFKGALEAAIAVISSS